MPVRQNSEARLIAAERLGLITATERRLVTRHWAHNDQLKSSPLARPAPNYLIQEETAHAIVQRAFADK
jgi:hypothetical protein